MAAKIRCGPVVGLVDSKRAYILLEIDREQNVSMVLSSSGRDTRGHRGKATLDMPANVPRVFVFTDLKPDTKYFIYVNQVEQSSVAKGSFFTLPEDPRHVNVGVVSCDYLEYNAGSKKTPDMWHRLCDTVRRERVHVVLHLGDNIYMDGEVSEKLSNKELLKSSEILDAAGTDRDIPYVEARRILKGQTDPGQWEESRERILDLYRQRYRDTWSRTHTARVLASCANLMILDDHDIRDDFGLLEEDGDPDSKEFWLGKLALQVYHEYQRQLWDPDIVLTPSKAEGLYNEFYTVRLGPLGLAFIDTRTPDSLYRPKRQEGDSGFYGREQKEAFERALAANEGGDGSDDVRMWLVSCGVPLLFFPDFVSRLLQKFSKTNDDLQVFTERTAEDIRPLWQAIRGWKSRRGPAGDILVLAGDVHVGGFTDIFCPPLDPAELDPDTDVDKRSGQTRFLCRQLTTSPICYKGWSEGELAVGKIALEAGRRRVSGTSIEYHHYGFVNTCNFAVVKIDFSNKRSLSYCAVLEKESGEAMRRYCRGGQPTAQGSSGMTRFGNWVGNWFSRLFRFPARPT